MSLLEEVVFPSEGNWKAFCIFCRCRAPTEWNQRVVFPQRYVPVSGNIGWTLFFASFASVPPASSQQKRGSVVELLHYTKDPSSPAAA